MNNSTSTSKDSPSNCLVLGGRGFIGSHLIDKLLQRGMRVRSFDRPHVVDSAGDRGVTPGLEIIDGDFSSDSDLSAAIDGCDVCYHLISTTLPKSSNADPVYDIESNLLATVKFLNIAVKSGVRKVVFASSGGTVYGDLIGTPVVESHPTDPICSYGITKLAIEKYLELYLRLHGLDYTVLRISNPYGERQRTAANQGVIAVFLGKVLRGEMVDIWGDGSVIRDYIYISDVVAALVAAHGDIGSHRIFNIGSGRGQSLNGVLDSISEVTGLPIKRRHHPDRLFDVPISVLSIDRAVQYLGWSPKCEFREGLLRFAKWLRENPDTHAVG